MNTDGTLDRDQMKKVGKLNPYLRDECGVPMKDSFRFAMVIVQNLDGILGILTDEEDGQMDEKKLEKFCHEHDIDCNDCPLRDECSEYYGKYHELPARRYKGDDNG